MNGVAAKGGNINGAGSAVASGMLFVPSGYMDLDNGVRGNVLLAFAPQLWADGIDLKTSTSSAKLAR